LGLLAATFMVTGQTQASPRPESALQIQALEVLKRGIAFRSVEGSHQVPAYAAYLKSLLVAGGYKDSEVIIEPLGETAFLIARFPGTDPVAKPIVINGHMDVVEAPREDWVQDPFTAVVEGGWIYGRGAVDNKFDISVVVTLLADLRRRGWKPGRDVILALSGDEETVMATSAVLAERLKGAEMVLNTDIGGGSLDAAGKPATYGIQASEKTYADFEITFTDPGGHSSRPTPGNAIYRMARALDRIAAFRFPPEANEVTRGALMAAAPTTPEPYGPALKAFAADPGDSRAAETLSTDPGFNAAIRTTCVATMISGGHAPNALPQRARAVVNCRIFPGTASEQVRQTLVRVVDDGTASITRLADGSIDSPASPLRADVMAALRKAVDRNHPGLPIVPIQSAGATDSMHFRAAGVPSYGVSGLYIQPGVSFTHGLNEKAPVAAIPGALAHWEVLLREIAK
jgi:acetylornithine deacetylase/succinyl-diaminopimelate desuccinylase-like protein